MVGTPPSAQPLRIIFAGTPEFARIALDALHAAGHTIALVLSQPDRPAGRGLKLQTSAVKQFALEHGLPVAQPRSLRLDGKFPDDAAQARDAIVRADADVMVVAAYGLLLPQWVLDTMQAPRPGRAALGCINIHGSLLPRWRGAAPIHRAIEHGDSHTGVTIMHMDAGLDTGAMLLQESLPIADDATTASLHDSVATLGARMVVQALALAAQGRLHPQPQPSAGVRYAHKIDKSEAAIDWAQDALSIVRRIRAFNPFPGASTLLNGEPIKIWHAQALPSAPTGHHTPGTILAATQAGIAVAAINSIVLITELQRAGGKRLAAGDFLRGTPLAPGMHCAPPNLAPGC